MFATGDFAEAVGKGIVIVFHVDVGADGLHLRCVELEKVEFGFDTVGRFEAEHIDIVARE